MRRVFALLLTLALLAGIAAAESISVRTAVDNVYIRNQNGSIITSVPQGGVVEVTGYSASLDMFSASYGGKTGYIKGTGLTVSRDELMKLCSQQSAESAEVLRSATQSAEGTVSFSALTDDQLRLLYQGIMAEAQARGISLTEIRALNSSEPVTLPAGKYIVGSDIEPGRYLITCLGTSTDDLSQEFGSLGSMLDGLSGSGDSTYSSLYSSLGSMFSSLDSGAKVEIIGDFGAVIKSVQLKKGESATLTLEGKVALQITDGTCRLERK